MAPPRIAAIKHSIQTAGNVLLTTITKAYCTDKSRDDLVSRVLPVNPGKAARQKIIMKKDSGITTRYPRIMSFKSKIMAPHKTLARKIER